jgi:D-alanyl-D-alanine carboxypeptidase
MFKRAFTVGLSVIVILSLLVVTPVYGLDEDVTEYDTVEVMKIMSNTSLTDLKAKAAILMDCSTGTILLEKNSHEKLR